MAPTWAGPGLFEKSVIAQRGTLLGFTIIFNFARVQVCATYNQVQKLFFS